MVRSKESLDIHSKCLGDAVEPHETSAPSQPVTNQGTAIYELDSGSPPPPTTCPPIHIPVEQTFQVSSSTNLSFEARDKL